MFIKPTETMKSKKSHKKSSNIAVAAQQVNKTLEYDAENMKITNCEEANNYFHYEYRNGWKF
jgi:hypothetical protein